MAKATLRSSFGYRDPATGKRRYYGPGEDIDVPEGLARTLGLPDRPGGRDEFAPPELQTNVGDLVTGALPADFPGKEYLAAAGYTDPYRVKALTFDELVALPGIGKATARKIIDAVGELE